MRDGILPRCFRKGCLMERIKSQGELCAMIDNHLRVWDKNDLAEAAREILNVNVKLLEDGDFRVTIPSTQAGLGDVIEDRRGFRGVVESIHGLRLRFVTDGLQKLVAQEGSYDVLRRIQAEPYIPIMSVGSARSEIVRQIAKRRTMLAGEIGSREVLRSEIKELERRLWIIEGKL